MPVCFCCAYPLPELILQDAAENVPAACFEAEEQEGQQPEHEVGLFVAYHKRQSKNTGTTPAHQLSHYIDGHGGIILRPHCAQMSDRLLANMIFCKCNAS